MCAAVINPTNNENSLTMTISDVINLAPTAKFSALLALQDLATINLVHYDVDNTIDKRV